MQSLIGRRKIGRPLETLCLPSERLIAKSNQVENSFFFFFQVENSEPRLSSFFLHVLSYTQAVLYFDPAVAMGSRYFPMLDK